MYLKQSKVIAHSLFTLIVYWKPGHGTNVEEPISDIVVLVCSKHIGQHVFSGFDAEGPVIKISFMKFYGYLATILDLFHKNDKQILNLCHNQTL